MTLPPGTRLRDYEITRLIAEGAFGIVYLAWDHALQRKVAIKEYLPASIATRADDSAAVVVADRQLDTFKAGLASFVGEARLLARFDHPSLVKVYRFWEDNGTAYMVPCPTTRARPSGPRSPSSATCRAKPSCASGSSLSSTPSPRSTPAASGTRTSVPTRSCSPPNGPVLLGFASAAHAIEAIHHTPAVALCRGFAAIEQYGSAAGNDARAVDRPLRPGRDGVRRRHGQPIRHRPPTASPATMCARCRSLRPGSYSAALLAAIDAAMAVQPQQRPADHAEFRALMGDIEAPAHAPAHAASGPHAGAVPAGARRPRAKSTVPDRPRLAVAEPARPAVAPVVARRRPPAARPARAARHRRAPPRRPPAPAGGLPSWMTSGPRPAAARRVLYGVVAAACALIGIAALVLQFAARTERSGIACRGVGARLHGSDNVAASACDASGRLPSLRRRRSPSRPRLPCPSPRRRCRSPVPRAGSCRDRRTARPESSVRRAALDILQKASLEPITPAETDFFKKECK